MVGDIHVNDASSVVGENDEDEQDAEGCRGDGEEVDRRTLRQVVRRNVRQVGDGDDGRRPRYLATVVSPISMPSF